MNLTLDGKDLSWEEFFKLLDEGPVSVDDSANNLDSEKIN